MPTVRSRSERMQRIIFSYPESKKILLNKRYGKNLNMILSLFADKLISDNVPEKDPYLQMEILFPQKARYIKTTQAQIDAVKEMLSEGKLSQKMIAAKVGVSDAIVSQIKHKTFVKYQ